MFDHKVPSLSNTAMRSADGKKSGSPLLPGPGDELNDRTFARTGIPRR
jgi:hypothetical protein